MAVIGYRRLLVFVHPVVCMAERSVLYSFRQYKEFRTVMVFTNSDFNLSIVLVLYASPSRSRVNYGNRFHVMQECK